MRRLILLLILTLATTASAHKIPAGSTDQYIYFVAVDSTDFHTRETGLSSFTVYYSIDSGAGTAMTTPTVAETDASNMPGVYDLLIDEAGMTTLVAGEDTHELTVHITHAGMDPVTRAVTIYRTKITEGQTVDAANGGIDVETIRGAAPDSASDIVNEWETQSQADPTGFHVNVMEQAGTAQTANDQGADINTLVTYVGTPIALDGGSATLGSMLTKIADDNGGADFDATTDSLEKLVVGGGGGDATAANQVLILAELAEADANNITVLAELAEADANDVIILDYLTTTGVAIVNDGITAAKIAADAIGASEIASNAITVGTEFVGFPSNWASMVISAAGAADVLVQGYMNTLLTESTAGNIADNNSTFWDNGDAATTKTVDDVGSAAGGASDLEVIVNP